nr:ribonuclease H-like domain, reverse transcriptase, RNA-dependent DNA polymerase [Tanacetum cinerariifolium]
MGYEKILQKLTIYKAFFSPQWKFIIHTILQCLSSKTTAWNEFSSTMASAIICLATNPKFNFSKYIFESMVKNLDNVNKFLMYLRKTKKKDTELPQTSGPTTNIADEAINEDMNDSLERAVTTASSLKAEQESGEFISGSYKVSFRELARLALHVVYVHYMDCTYGKVACITHKLKGQVPIGGNHDWSFSKKFLECLKGFNTLFGEEEYGIFLKKMGHRSGYLPKVFYESSIEVGMTKKSTDTLDGSGMRYLSDYINFSLIYLNAILGDLMAEDDALFDHEMTFPPI